MSYHVSDLLPQEPTGRLIQVQGSVAKYCLARLAESLSPEALARRAEQGRLIFDYMVNDYGEDYIRIICNAHYPDLSEGPCTLVTVDGSDVYLYGRRSFELVLEGQVCAENTVQRYGSQNPEDCYVACTTMLGIATKFYFDFSSSLGCTCPSDPSLGCNIRTPLPGAQIWLVYDIDTPVPTLQTCTADNSFGPDCDGPAPGLTYCGGNPFTDRSRCALNTEGEASCVAIVTCGSRKACSSSSDCMAGAETCFKGCCPEAQCVPLLGLGSSGPAGAALRAATTRMTSPTTTGGAAAVAAVDGGATMADGVDDIATAMKKAVPLSVHGTGGVAASHGAASALATAPSRKCKMATSFDPASTC